MRLYNDKECEEKTKYGRVQRWRLEKSGRFPKRIKLGKRRIAWVAEEIDDWIAQRIAERDKVGRP